MSVALGGFGRSKLGAFIRSTLGARGYPDTAVVGDLFVSHFSPTSFDGVSGKYVHMYDKGTLSWVSTDSGLSTGLPSLFYFAGRVYAHEHGSTSTNRLQSFNASTQTWENAASWAYATNTITVSVGVLLAELNGDLYISTTSTGSNITVSTGGSANIVKFDGSTFSTVGSLPVASVGALHSGQGMLIAVDSSTSLTPVWYSADGATWTRSSLTEDASSGGTMIISKAGRVLAVHTTTNYNTTSPCVEWSNIATDTYTHLGANNRPRITFAAANTAIGSTIYFSGADFDVPVDGVVAITSGGAISQYDDDLMVSDQRGDILALEEYDGAIYAGTFSTTKYGSPPNNFYLLPSYTEGLGSSGTNLTTERVHQILHVDLNIPIVTIDAPADSSSHPTGSTIGVTFEGTATDNDGLDISADIVWTSNLDGSLGTGATITTTISAGAHTITAKATDSQSRTGAVTIFIFAS